MNVELLFYLCLMCLLGGIVWYSWRYGITPTPTSFRVKHRLMDVLPLVSNGQIIELGSGWGTLAFALAHHFPKVQVMAYEISPIPYLVSKFLAQLRPLSNLKIARKDFFAVSFAHTSLAVCYLYPQAMMRLKTKFEKELAPTAYVLSHTFAVPGWIPIRVEYASDLYRTPIYLYQIRLSVTKILKN